MKRLYIVLLLVALVGCKADRCDTPFGEGGTIDITMPEFADLSNVGGAMTINRGHRGIHITRMSYSDFVAFECSCPNDHDVRLLPDTEWGNSVLSCPVCSSRFNALDGTPLSGSATPCPLYQYNTDFDGRLLTIY